MCCTGTHHFQVNVYSFYGMRFSFQMAPYVEFFHNLPHYTWASPNLHNPHAMSSSLLYKLSPRACSTSQYHDYYKI